MRLFNCFSLACFAFCSISDATFMLYILHQDGLQLINQIEYLSNYYVNDLDEELSFA